MNLQKKSQNTDTDLLDSFGNFTDHSDHPQQSESPLNLIAVLNRANHIARADNVDDLLDQMLALMVEVVGGNAVTFYLLDREAGELIFTVIKGDEYSQRLVGLRIKHDQGIAGAALLRSHPIVTDDLSNDPRWYGDINPDKGLPQKSAITVPALLEGKPIGVIQIFNFTKPNLELLQILSDRLAHELEKILRLEESNRMQNRFQALVDMIKRTGRVSNRDQLLRLVTEQAAYLLEAERSSIFLVDAPTQDIAFRASYQAPSSESEHKSPVYALVRGVLLDSKLSTQKTRPTGIKKQRFGISNRSVVSKSLTERHYSFGQGEEGKERTIGGLMVVDKQQGHFDAEDSLILEVLADQASNLLKFTQLYTNANELFVDVIKALVAAIDAKDPYTQGHSQRVSDLSVAIAKELELDDDELHNILIGSLLHDVGKIGVPDYILLKPGRLTTEEYAQIKRHPAIGKNIMGQVNLLRASLPAISEHHERLDGSGYPLGLHGNQISLMGRIVAVADVFDAMTTDRPYRKGMDTDTVLTYLQDNISDLFDGRCVKALRTNLSHHSPS